MSTIYYAHRFCEPEVWTGHSGEDLSLLYLASLIAVWRPGHGIISEHIHLQVWWLVLGKLKELRASKAEAPWAYLFYVVSTCELFSIEASKYLDFFACPIRSPMAPIIREWEVYAFYDQALDLTAWFQYPLLKWIVPSFCWDSREANEDHTSLCWEKSQSYCWKSTYFFNQL